MWNYSCICVTCLNFWLKYCTTGKACASARVEVAQLQRDLMKDASNLLSKQY